MSIYALLTGGDYGSWIAVIVDAGAIAAIIWTVYELVSNALAINADGGLRSALRHSWRGRLRGRAPSKE